MTGQPVEWARVTKENKRCDARAAMHLSIFMKRMTSRAASTTKRKLENGIKKETGEWHDERRVESTRAGGLLLSHAADEAANGARVLIGVAHALRACSRTLTHSVKSSRVNTAMGRVTHRSIRMRSLRPR